MKVIIRNVAPYWNGKEGELIRWVHDSWYIVKVDNRELVLDFTRGEIEYKGEKHA